MIGAGWLGLPLAKALLSSDYRLCVLASGVERKKTLEGVGLTSLLLTETGMLTFKPEIAIVTLPPMRQKANGELPWDYHEFVCQQLSLINANKILVTSSTSVYPEAYKTYTELDPIPEGEGTRLENMYSATSQHSTIVRFGGLFGPNRHPGNFLSGKTFTKPQAPVNFVHLNDAVNAMIHLTNLNTSNGVWNVVHPDHPSKREFYSECCTALKTPLPTFEEQDLSLGKTVNSSKLTASGFHYQLPQLKDYLSLCI